MNCRYMPAQIIISEKTNFTHTAFELLLHSFPQLLVEEAHLVLVPLVLVSHQKAGKLELFSTETTIRVGRGFGLTPTLLHSSNLLLPCVGCSRVELQDIFREETLSADVTGKLGVGSIASKQFNFIFVPFLLVGFK